MRNTVRTIVALFTKILPIDLLKNILGLSVLGTYIESIKKAPFFKIREELWKHVFKDFEDQKIAVLEFGVYKGYSINYLSSLNFNQESLFVGFDSFEGLPKEWPNFFRRFPAGHFGVNGELPQISDDRISFLKGWFSETLCSYLDSVDFGNYQKLVVHLDADIYGSTLYVLTQLGDAKKEITIIFDELPGEEARAFSDFLDAFGGEVEFLGSADGTKSCPKQVIVKYTK